MHDKFEKAFIAGVERISAWADLLDEINVYPVADGDTGRNLIISLSPLRQIDKNREKTVEALLLAARGNSGNIAARFFSGFITANEPGTLVEAAARGRKFAWEALFDPKKGTMLTVFDALADILEKGENNLTPENIKSVLDHLEDSVHSTTKLLPRLKKANVVDAGALGMFLYFEGFFNALSGNGLHYRPIMEIFRDKLAVSSSFKEESETGYCVDMVLKANDKSAEEIRKLAESDASAVVIRDKDYLKVHIHTEDRAKTKGRFESYDMIKWSDDDLSVQIKNFKTKHKRKAIHIITDGAGSVTHNDVKNMGITLLASYIISGKRCVPETHFDPEELYNSMQNGIKASTSQASDFERHQHYESVLSRYRKVLYLCVGSVYTGNYRVAMDWKNKHDPGNRMTVIDTGTASGRLGLAVIAAARFSQMTSKPADVVKFAEKAVERCREYIFLEKLHYLAAGGRMSKTGAFFGDLLNVKPIVSPHSDGAGKEGIARSTKEQLKFLYSKMEADLKPDTKAIIMLEYTNNLSWVGGDLKKQIQKKYPESEILLQPLSLTTGVHTGPGTWAVAYLDAESINIK